MKNLLKGRRTREKNKITIFYVFLGGFGLGFSDCFFRMCLLPLWKFKIHAKEATEKKIVCVPISDIVAGVGVSGAQNSFSHKKRLDKPWYLGKLQKS